MSKKQVGPAIAIREERFVETNSNAFRILSKEESDKRREQAKENRKKTVATTQAAK